jgi:lipopolysaccharide export system ATP-binding protein
LNITDYVQESTTGNWIFSTGSFCFRKLSIEDNILSVLQLTKLSKEQVAKMESLIEEFSLEHIRTNRGIYYLVKRRRTSTRCLATDPKFIWMNLLRVSIL